jgi:hypothetical protein
MRNKQCIDYSAVVTCPDAAILEALIIDRATVMFQSAWHTPASLLFEKMERFDNDLKGAGTAAAYRESMASRSDTTSPKNRTGGIAWDIH